MANLRLNSQTPSCMLKFSKGVKTQQREDEPLRRVVQVNQIIFNNSALRDLYSLEIHLMKRG